MEQVYIGIDVSKDRLDVHVHPSGEAFAVGRSGEGLEELIAKLRPLAPALVVLEATGGFEAVAAAALAGADLPLVVANPTQVRHYAQALGRRAKTDAIDTEVIARFAAALARCSDGAVVRVRHTPPPGCGHAGGRAAARAARQRPPAGPKPGPAHQGSGARTGHPRPSDRRAGARLPGVAREAGFACLRPGRQTRDSPHPPRRDARVGKPGPPCHRQSRQPFPIRASPATGPARA